MRLQSHARVVTAMFALSAIFYNSWPLGYYLNPGTARNGLASDLDAHGQAFNWLFIASDFLVGACLLAVCVLIRLKLKGLVWTKGGAMLLIGLVLFGLFTATSAAAPTDCTQGGIPVCAHFDKRLFRADGIESAVAALGLFASLVGINIIIAGRTIRPSLSRIARISLIVWPASVIIFLMAAAANRDSHITQQILLVVAGAALLVIGLSINVMLEEQVASSAENNVQ